MKKYKAKKRWLIAPLSVVLLASAGCASNYTSISTLAPKEYSKLGQAEGVSTGSLGILGTATNVIPMGLNERVEKAYANALAQYPEATGLIDVTYQEDWYWWFIGTARKVTVKGTAIKEVK